MSQHAESGHDYKFGGVFESYSEPYNIQTKFVVQTCYCGDVIFTELPKPSPFTVNPYPELKTGEEPQPAQPMWGVRAEVDATDKAVKDATGKFDLPNG